MDKLDELAREAAEHLLRYLKDDEVKIKLVGGIVDDWLPYLRRAYEMGREARLANRVKTIQDIVDIANENEILRPVEPVEKPQNMSGTDMRINLEIREREIAVKDEEIKELRTETKMLYKKIRRIIGGYWS